MTRPKHYKKHERCPACGASSSAWRKEKPVVFGKEDWLEAFVCGGHIIENLKSKKTTLDKHDFKSPSLLDPVKNVYMPLVAPMDRCDQFKPIRLDGRGVGFVNARKFYLLDKAGVFDDMEWKEG